MSSFLKSIFHSNRHKKLCEEWTQAREPVIDGVTFYVRYLGSSLVEDPKSASSTAAGVKRIIHSAKAGARRPERVSFRVGMDGVKIDSTSTGRNLMDTSIYKISYCSADSQYDQVLAFVASNEDETCECHAFLCSKRKVAEAIAVSIAQAFTMAYECWKFAVEAKRNGGESFSSEQASNTTGGSSPCRDDSKDMSRGSSPGHSPSYSSPSEVSSTSGYQSSTPGGLLLEFEELNCEDGTDHALNRQCSTDIDLNRVMPTADRKHWVEFGSSEAITSSMGNLYGNKSQQLWRSYLAESKPPSTSLERRTSFCSQNISSAATRNCSFTSRRINISNSRFSFSDGDQLLAGV